MLCYLPAFLVRRDPRLRNLTAAGTAGKPGSKHPQPGHVLALTLYKAGSFYFLLRSPH